MLLYLGEGERRYRGSGVQPFTRPAWEFQAVLKGAIGPLLPDREVSLHRRTLWLFPPGHCHFWEGEAGRLAEVVVFHFPAVPEPLATLFASAPPPEIALSESECRRLRVLAAQARRYWQKPQTGMIICHEHILMELSLLVLQRLPVGTLDRSEGNAADRVNAVIAWFGRNLSSNPGLECAARANGMSASHLRRLFHQILRTSPKEVFDQLRFQKALRLMADRKAKLAAISEACGFGDPSSFSRAFKAKFGLSPAKWRG